MGLTDEMQYVHIESAGDSNRKRKPRTRFERHQLEALEKAFVSAQYPDHFHLQSLSITTGLDDDTIQVWFKNRRQKEKRTSKSTSRTKRKRKSSSSSAHCLNKKMKVDCKLESVHDGYYQEMTTHFPR
uniref:Visual system homeobox 1-like n=1 Tax=Saccoglossus kowalevskii TaxID=10224 RepID=A0ABM0MP69_SACKO